MTKNEVLGHRAASEILYNGLADSTFREKFPEAYFELQYVQKDIAKSITNILNKSRLR